MNPEAECEECRRLHDEASTAITRQLRAISRLDLARLRYQSDQIAAMEAVVREARQAREAAVAAYKEHRKRHSADPAGGYAKAQAQ